MTINYAHRGASGYYPENTMKAFEEAVKLGADGIETDVHMTKDGVLVLIHDEQVDRTTGGTGWIKDYTYKELLSLDAGSWFHKDFNNERIPTLESLLEFSKHNGILLNLELKNNIIQYENLEKKVIDLIYKYNLRDKAMLSSFNHYSIVECKKISQEIKVGLLYSSGIYKPEVYASFVGVEALHPHFYALREEIVKGIKEKGIGINTYTVNEMKYMEPLVQWGVDGIITNYPDRLKDVIEKFNV